ncbi:hypothetical protein WKH46_05845 [Pantoea agglomerans]|uniref:hypothetical protein n=1 Tax=Enterobacter agglomerans TaxID=549 RepID=UPI003C7C3447
MKKYPHGLTLNAVCAAIDDYQRHEDSVPEEGILAAFSTLLGHSDIADALRSMERTADTNMAAAQAMRDDMYHWKQRAEAAEAKLAELTKQQPRYQIQKKQSYGRESVWIDVANREEAETNVLHGYRWRMVYDAPAPAADLVPDNDLMRVISFAKFVIKCVRKNGEYAPLSSQEPHEIDAILRNIEEAK